MSEMTDMHKLIMAMKLAKTARVGMGLTYFDVIELLGELDSLKSYIAELEAAQRWIPVSERLPEDTERMLTIVCDAFEDTTAISILQHYGDGDWFSWDSGRYVVTHWMPLPELPKECE